MHANFYLFPRLESTSLPERLSSESHSCPQYTLVWDARRSSMYHSLWFQFWAWRPLHQFSVLILRYFVYDIQSCWKLSRTVFLQYSEPFPSHDSLAHVLVILSVTIVVSVLRLFTVEEATSRELGAIFSAFPVVLPLLGAPKLRFRLFVFNELLRRTFLGWTRRCSNVWSHAQPSREDIFVKGSFSSHVLDRSSLLVVKSIHSAGKLGEVPAGSYYKFLGFFK